MGSVYAGILGDAGNEVWAVDVWTEHVEGINRDGLTIEGASGRRTVRHQRHVRPGRCRRVRARRDRDQGRDVETAAEHAKPLLGRAPSCCRSRTASAAPTGSRRCSATEAVVIGVAGGFGASIVGPGHVHHNGWELVRLGERNGPGDAANPPDRQGMGGRGVPRPGVRRGRPARVGEADLQRHVQRHVHDPRAHDRRGARRPVRVAGRVRLRPEAYAVALARGSRSTFDDPVAYARAFGAKIAGRAALDASRRPGGPPVRRST